MGSEDGEIRKILYLSSFNMDGMTQDYIIVEGASENNLKHISLRIPKNRSLFLPVCPVPENRLWFWIRLPPNPGGS